MVVGKKTFKKMQIDKKLGKNKRQIKGSELTLAEISGKSFRLKPFFFSSFKGD